VIKKNPRPRPCRNRPGAARSIRSRPDPIDPTPRARRSRARARTRREDRPRIERAKKQSARVARPPLARVVASSSRSRSPIAHPSRETARVLGGLQKLGLISRVTARQTRHTLAVSVAGRTTARATRSERRRRRTPTRRWFPTDRARTNGARVVAVHRASVPLLLSLLGGRLDGDRRGSLDVRGRDDKHSICFFRARVCRRATRSSRDRDRSPRPITDDGTTSGDSSFHGGLRSTVCSIEFTCHLVRLCMSVNDRVYLCFILLWISIRHQIWYGMVCGSDTNGRFASFGDGFHSVIDRCANGRTDERRTDRRRTERRRRRRRAVDACFRRRRRRRRGNIEGGTRTARGRSSSGTLREEKKTNGRRFRFRFRILLLLGAIVDRGDVKILQSKGHRTRGTQTNARRRRERNRLGGRRNPRRRPEPASGDSAFLVVARGGDVSRAR